jgi:RNA 2',3'-cyclic 3'-phosphodiesterase
MRLFVGWPLAEDHKAVLAARVAPLRAALPAASWTRPEVLHLTLLFLGETDEGSVPALIGGLDRLCGRAAIPLQIARPGFFPGRKRPRVAWIGLEPRDPIGELAAAVRVAAGAEPDRRPFHPHLTLARIRGSWAKGDVELFESAFAGLSLEGVLDRVILFESRLSSAGAQHLPLHEARLRKDPLPQSIS